MSTDLRRSMSLPHAAAIVVGTILGASIFLQPSEISRLVPSTRGLLLVWLGAGALTACGALVCGELAATFPETGGVYVFLKKIFSPAVGFLWGWAMFWSMHSGIVAALATILGRYTAYFVPLGEGGQRAVAVAAILALSGINYLSIKPGSALQLALTTAKLAAIAVMVLLIFAFGGRAHHALASASHTERTVTLAAYGLAIAAGLFAFGGWHMVTYTAGETRDPEQTIPRALLIGTVVVTLCYVLLKRFYFDTVNFDPRAIELAITFAGADRILAGSDYPHQIGSIPKMLDSLKAIRVSDEDRKKVLGGNAKRLLGAKTASV
jgi:basic amino acid/polyamine antiporter, APA family